MSLCDLQATGIFGWADIGMWLFCSSLIGARIGIRLGRYLESIDPREPWRLKYLGKP